MSSQSVIEVAIQTVEGALAAERADSIAVEEPLEIQLGYVQEGVRLHKTISITMRTPGSDFDLAIGFLFTEGIVQSPAQVAAVRLCELPSGPLGLQNVARVDLQSDVSFDFQRLERHFYTSSSCGVCGKTSIAALKTGAGFRLVPDSPQISADLVHRLPQVLREAQSVFDRTGGLHAAALFDTDGTLLMLREDVGRHNAVDKVIGAQVRARQVPLDNRVLLVSGRASFELMQKALMAGIPILAAVGAPSSLAVDLARDAGASLLGFVRNDRFNIYAGAGRIIV